MTATDSPRNAPASTAVPSAKPRRRANQLSGKEWLQNSISVWSDIRKTAEETRLKHPALFPRALVERLVDTFLPPDGTTLLDPFCGSGSTLLVAAERGLAGIGLELSSDYVQLTRQRLQELQKQREESQKDNGASRPEEENPSAGIRLICDSAANVSQHVAEESVDLCITSPPYWNILTRRRTADYKAVRHYGHHAEDLGRIDGYPAFLDALQDVFRQVFRVLRLGAFACVVVMDLRKKNRFFPFHSDLAGRLSEIGFIYDDLIIWNRQSEYNNLRPLGYPSVFRVNKVHEFILLLQKPRELPKPRPS